MPKRRRKQMKTNVQIYAQSKIKVFLLYLFSSEETCAQFA